MTAAPPAAAWLYTGVYPKEGHNQSRSRKPDGPQRLGQPSRLGFRLAVQPPRALQPRLRRPGRAAVVGAQEAGLVGRGGRRVDRARRSRFRRRTSGPDFRPDWSKQPTAWTRSAATRPFIMDPRRQAHAVRAVRPAGRPAADALRAGRKPGREPAIWAPDQSPDQAVGAAGKRDTTPSPTRAFPMCFTTYRLTELHCGGVATRAMPHTAELQPEAFVEIPPELARELGIRTLD